MVPWYVPDDCCTSRPRSAKTRIRGYLAHVVTPLLNRCCHADRTRGGSSSYTIVRMYWLLIHVLQPTGTSNKFVNMMCQALEVFQEQHSVRIEKVTQILLEGEGTISKRGDKCVQL